MKPSTPPLCIRCDEPVTRVNDSREHVIPNAVGGRLKTRGFICKRCNSEAGQGWDAELAQQLNPLSLFFGIARERGAPPPHRVQTVTGQKLFLNPGGKLTLTKSGYTKQEIGAGTQIQVSARTMAEARQVLEGLRRRHPDLNVEDALKNTSSTWIAPDGPVTFSLDFGGEEAGRSIVKTAAAFACHCGIDTRGFGPARRYLKDSKAEPCFGYYFESDLVQGRPQGTPLHCVAISGDPDTGLLLGYVEYFGFQRVVVCLSEEYQGQPISRSYAIDPTNGQELKVAVHMAFTPADVRAIYDYDKAVPEEMRAALAAVLPGALRRQADAERDRVLSEAVDYGFANCGAKPGDVLTAEQVQKLSWLVAQRMTPFLMNRIQAAHRARVAALTPSTGASD